jgi:endonuclease/exonuclease/phosphatase family metal-dependent hydrolase
MAYYWKLRRLKPEHRRHVADRLLALRNALREQVTENRKSGELRIATWNLMHFGGSGSYKRTTESLLYIAEIIDHFDLVSIQEVKRDLTQLKDLVSNHLGNEWDYIVSDTTEGDAGNDERMAVLYRKGRVLFSRMAGEIVLPADQSVSGGAVLEDDSGLLEHRQFARSPYYLGFQAGWFKFKLCSVHIHYGKKSGEHREIRIAEIARLAQLLKKRSDDERKAEVKFAKSKKWDTTPSTANYILLGDFNIHDTRHDRAMKALTDNGFEIPDEIEGMSTNTGKEEEPFDQIALRLNDARFRQGTGGVFDYRRLVYRRQDSEFYWKTVGVPKLKERENKGEDAEGIENYFCDYYRKHQISDHLLLWTSFEIDYADDYLEELSADDLT